MLQYQIDRDRKLQAMHAKEVQLNLAKARSLLALEFALRDLASFRPGSDPAITQRCAQQVTFAARSLLESNHLLGAEANRESRRIWYRYKRDIPLRTAALTLAESLQLFEVDGLSPFEGLVQVFADRRGGWVAVTVMLNGKAILLRNISDESFPLWESFMVSEDETDTYVRLKNWADYRSTSEALANDINRMISALIAHNVEMAAEYYEFRSQAVQMHKNACAL